MQRYKIFHRTYYNFSGSVQLGPHTLRLRPREGHELRIESSSLKLTPAATLRWRRDVEDNSVAIASFDTPARQLIIETTKPLWIFWWPIMRHTTRSLIQPRTGLCCHRI